MLERALETSLGRGERDKSYDHRGWRTNDYDERDRGSLRGGLSVFFFVRLNQQK